MRHEAEQPSCHHDQPAHVLARGAAFGVVHEDTRQVEQAREPGDDRDQMQRFDPQHDMAP